MGIEALHTKPKTTTANKEHYKYPYLLKDFRDYADQGSQYTSKEHTNILKKHGIQISMDGVGRATDNIAIEKYMNSYNQRRLHSTIRYKTPNEVYYQADNNLDAKGVKSLPLVS